MQNMFGTPEACSFTLNRFKGYAILFKILITDCVVFFLVTHIPSIYPLLYGTEIVGFLWKVLFFLVNCSVHVPVSIFIPFKTFLPNHFEFDSWCILSSVWIRDALWGVNITDRAACTNIYIYIHYKLSLIHLNQNNNQKMICTKEAIDDWFPIKPNHNTYLFITKHPTSKHNQNWNESFFL